MCIPSRPAAGFRLPHADAGRMGFRHDRQWMSVDEHGMFVAQRGSHGLASKSEDIACLDRNH